MEHLPPSDADGEPLIDMYGTPWGSLLGAADPAVLRVTGTPTIRIRAGIPNVPGEDGVVVGQTDA